MSADGPEIGRAYVVVLPDMSRFMSQVQSGMKSAGARAGSSFDEGFSKASKPKEGGRRQGQTYGQQFISEVRSKFASGKGALSSLASGAATAGRSAGGRFAASLKEVISSTRLGGAVGKAGSIASAFAQHGINAGKGFVAKCKSAISALRSLGRTEGGSVATNFASGFSTVKMAVGTFVGNALMSAVGAVTGSISSGVSRVDTISNFTKMMPNLGYSADAARASITRMGEAIDGLPTSLDAMASAATKIAPISGSIEDATNVTIALNDALVAGGKSSELQANALEQYSQMLSVGKVDMQAWKSMVNAMPAQMNQVARSMLGASATSMDLYEAMKSGEVTFDDFNEALVRLDSEGADGFSSFADQARTASDNIGTAVDNVRNRLAKGWASVIEAVGQSNIAGWIDSFSSSFKGGFGLVTDAIEGFKSSLDLSAAQAAVQPLATLLNGIFDTVREKAPGLGAQLARGLQGILTTAVPLITQVATIARDAASTVGPALQGLLAAIAPVVGDLMLQASTFLATNQPLFQQAAQWVADGIGAARQFIEDHRGDIGGFFAAALSFAGETVPKAWEALQPILQRVGEFAAAVMPPLLDALRQVWDAIGPALKKIYEALAPVISQVADIAQKLLPPLIQIIGNHLANSINLVANLVAALAGVANVVLSVLRSVFNVFADGWNATLANVDFTVPSWVPVAGGTRVRFPSLPRLADGGIVTRAQYAMLGEGGDPEAVVPLNERKVSEFVRGLQGGGGAAGGVTVNVSIDTVVVRDERSDARKVADRIGRETALTLKARGVAA